MYFPHWNKVMKNLNTKSNNDKIKMQYKVKCVRHNLNKLHLILEGYIEVFRGQLPSSLQMRYHKSLKCFWKLNQFSLGGFHSPMKSQTAISRYRWYGWHIYFILLKFSLILKKNVWLFFNIYFWNISILLLFIIGENI